MTDDDDFVWVKPKKARDSMGVALVKADYEERKDALADAGFVVFTPEPAEMPVDDD